MKPKLFLLHMENGATVVIQYDGSMMDLSNELRNKAKVEASGLDGAKVVVKSADVHAIENWRGRGGV